MNRRTEIVLMLTLDMLMLNAAFIIFYLFRIESGLVAYSIKPEIWIPSLVLSMFWILWFFFFGLYTFGRISSRIEELLAVLRSSVFGILVLFFLIVVDDQAVQEPTSFRALILGYLILMITLVSIGRLTLRYVQRKLMIAGYGLHNALIVGWSPKAHQLCDMVLRFPKMGLKVVGFVRPESKKEQQKGRAKSYKNISILGAVNDLPTIVRKHEVSEVLIGLDSTQHDELTEVIRACDIPGVTVKIVPDLYDIVSGQARISSIYGFPLMDVRPELLRPWEAAAKRTLDIIVSSLVIVFGLPVWLIIGLAVKIDSPGPVLYKQERTGKNGVPFKILKFRSMRKDAEKGSGPVWAGKNDPRVTALGRFLRKSHLDEIPQFVNVLKGEMSLVGPRPERPFFVEKLAKEIPLYKHRHRVRPGITGWAQVKHKYDDTIEDVRTKVKYDLFYIENMSWRMDVTILLNTVLVMITGKGRA